MKRSVTVIALVTVACWVIPTDAAGIRGTKWNADIRLLGDMDANDLEWYVNLPPARVKVTFRGVWPNVDVSETPTGSVVRWSGHTVHPGQMTHTGLHAVGSERGWRIEKLTWTFDGEPFWEYEFEDGWTSGGEQCSVKHRAGPPPSENETTHVRRRWARAEWDFELDSMVPGNTQLEGLAWTWIDAESIPVAPGESVTYAIQTVPVDSTILMRYKMWNRNEELVAEMISAADCSTYSGVAESDFGPGRPAYSLHIIPNPAAGRATVRYSLPKAGDIRLGLYDVTGALVTTLADGHHNPGHHQRALAVEDGEKALKRGVYFVKLETADHRRAEKVVIR